MMCDPGGARGEYRNVLLVPGEDVHSGSLLAAAEASLVINVRGTVVKDRYGPCGRQANDDESLKPPSRPAGCST